MKDDTARTQYLRYVRARDAGHTDYMALAKKCDSYYRGEQWTEQDLARLRETGRPALTINTILSTVNAVLGEQASQRGDIQFRPRRDGEQEIADTLTKLYLQIGDNNNFDWIESQVFADGIIQDRGYFDIRMDFDDHIDGEIKITSLDPIDVVLDPDAKAYDPDTWTEVFHTKWLSLEDIKHLYGAAKAQELRAIAENGQHFSKDSFDIEDTRFGDTLINGDVFTNDSRADTKDIKAVRVIERQARKLVNVKHFVDNEQGDTRPIPDDWDDARVDAFAQEHNLSVIKRMDKKVRWTVTADKTVLHDEWSPYAHFTIVPFFPYFRRGKPFGMVRNLLSPQEQLNKVSSQELHIVNTTANSGYMVENGSLTNMSLTDLELRGAETGLVLEFAKGSTPPVKIQPNQIPSGLDRISMKAANNIKEISGVSDSLLGQDSAEVSGVAIQAKQASGRVQIQVPLDNLTRTRYIVARNILSIVQRYYTEQRIIRVVGQDPMTGAPTEEQMTVNEVTPTGAVINNITLGEYDVIVTSVPQRDTFDDSQFAEALQLRQTGIMVPDDAVLEYSHLARKHELADRIRQMNGQAEPTEEEMQMQQMQQEAQMQSMQLELQKLQAEVQNLSAQAQLTMAKAQDIPADNQLEMMRMQSSLQEKQMELQARMNIAQASAQGKQKIARLGVAGTIAKQGMTNEAALLKDRSGTKK
jgi:hypothetical protein